ncbi:hypothetical protein [Taklimakanibacter deserti]|uniref:hypothetical protein n=1 Tax=Taklimakanibacter deserti TaxID=2267839 RepID=UPI000E64E8A1
MARAKYFFLPIEEPGAVLIRTMDVPELLKEVSTKTSPTPLPAEWKCPHEALRPTGHQIENPPRGGGGNKLQSRAIVRRSDLCNASSPASD